MSTLPLPAFVDGTILSLRSVEWVARSVFFVRPSGPYCGFTVELSAIDLPVCGDTYVGTAIEAALNWVNTHRPRLRCDYLSCFPAAGWGDILFDLDGASPPSESSLQYLLLSCGVGRVTRPVSNLDELLAAEAVGATIPNSPIEHVARMEKSDLFLCECRARVVDVLRGDVFCVQLTDEGEKPFGPLDRPFKKGDVVLVMLQSVQCAPLEMETGWQAFTFSRQQLFDRDVTVHFHSFQYSDKDTANNTQMQCFEQLEHCTVSVFRGSPNDVDSSVACGLLIAGFAKVRSPLAPTQPRATDFLACLRCAVGAAQASEAVLQGLRSPCTTGAEGQRHASTTGTSPLQDTCMTQQLLWYRFLADSDMSHDPSAEPTVHAFMPLKLLVDRTRFAAQHPQISGYVTSMRAVPTTQQNFLAVQVMLSLSPSLVNAMKAGKQQEELGRITILPEPRLEFGSSVDCEIIYDPLLSGMEEQVEQIRVSCTSYRAGEFVVENHRPRFEAYTHAIELRLPANSAQPTLLFVVDAQVTFLNNHSVLSAQQTYQLSASGGASYVAAECVKIDEDDEQELVLADDKDEDAAPAHDRSRSRQATAGPGFFSLFPGEIKENTVKAYHSLVDIYFEVPPGESLEGKEDLLRPWLLQDVVVSILERCEVAGRKGFFADVRRDSASDSNRPADFPFSSAFSSASEHVPGSAAVEGPRTFGSLDIYCDGEGTAGCRTLTQSIPKDVSLFSFMLFPRMLFSCHSRHHKNIIPESQHRKYRGMVHLDYSFMRLHFPRLPNVFLTDIERLPLSLRPCHLDEVMKFVKVGDVKLVANVRALAGVFAALIGTFPRMVSLPEELNEVQDNFSMTVSRFTCSGFLLRHASSGVLVYRSKDSQPTEATTNDDATFSSIPAPFAARLGSAFAHAFFTDGDSTTQQPSNTVPLFQHYVSDDYTYRPMAQQGIGRRNMDLPTPVYHPFPGLAIVGEPTVSRHEELPEPHEAHFLMQFTPFRVAKRTSSLYKISSPWSGFT